MADGSTGFGPSDRVGTAAAPLDARLGPLADNGGPTLTRLPAAVSPAVDAGAAAAAPATDQRGRARVVGGAIDAGAVERQVDDPTNVTRQPVTRTFAVGSDAGETAAAQTYNPDGTLRQAVAPPPFGPNFTGGVRVAAADLTGDRVDDPVVASGPGIPTRVQVIDGQTRAMAFDLAPFEPAFTGGVYVAAGDGVADLVVTPDEGGGPRVDVYAGNGFVKVASFFGIDDVNFRGGARVATGDVTGDGVADLIVVAGFGGGPRVAGFDGRTIGGTPVRIFGDIFAFEQSLRNGVFVAVGDVDGDGFGDLIAGGGPGGGPRVTAFSGRALLANRFDERANFFGGDPNSRGGIRVTVKDLDGDDRADVVVGAGAGAGPRVTAYLGKYIRPSEMPPTAFDFDALDGPVTGVFVG